MEGSIMAHTFTVGERVASLRYKNGTVLDFSGVVVSLNAERTRAVIRFRDREEVGVQLHPDFVETMEPAYRLARRFRVAAERSGDVDESFEAVERVAAAETPAPDWFTTSRAHWVLRFDAAAVR